MIIYTSGDLFKSNAEALVNTVNCEGYMGKGLAYQFKKRYPENNLHYVKACERGDVKVGKMFCFEEEGTLIVNFPTKNKWRAKSRVEYIERGLEDLVEIIEDLNLKSIAIPPLGAGNGGLAWEVVKRKIESYLQNIEGCDIYIYEPSQPKKGRLSREPVLSLSALILMEIKRNLENFDSSRLQKTAFFMNVFLTENYFEFSLQRHGPYDPKIRAISKSIRDFQCYHNVQNTGEAHKILYRQIVSETIEREFQDLKRAIEKSANYVNKIDTNKELECVSSLTYLLLRKKFLSTDDLVVQFENLSMDKQKRFSKEDIIRGIESLEKAKIFESTLLGYSIHRE